MTSLDGSNITSGTVAAARVATLNQDTTGKASKVIVTDNNTATVFPVVFNDENDALLDDTGTFTYQPSTGTLSATKFSGDGASLTSLNGSNISSGTVAAARVATLNQDTTGTAAGLSATLAVNSGGTGQTSYTNGQLLIGNNTGNTLTRSTLTAGDGISITNGTGSITIANNTIIKSTVTHSSGSDIRSGAMLVPANSIITRLTCVVKTELTHDNSAATTVKVGDTPDTDNIATAVNIQASGTANTAVGKGSSTDTAITSGLGGVASIVVGGSLYNITEIHFTVNCSANLSAGTIIFIVEYI